MIESMAETPYAQGTEFGGLTRPMRTPALIRNAFALLLTYYWALQYAITMDTEVQRGDALYYLFVVPIAAFSLTLLLGARLSRRSTPSAFWFIGYALTVMLIAVVRADFQTFYNTTLFAGAALVILVYRLTPSVNLINGLFFASIVVNTMAFASGRSIYAVLPGFSEDGELWWRISLFPKVAPSAFFALIVLFVNISRRGGTLRRTCGVLAAYFVLFSGLRSALVAGLLAALYYGLTRRGKLKRTSAKMTYLVLSLAFFVVSLFATQLLLLLPAFGSEALNIYLFRAEGGLESEADVARSVFRTWLWAEHVRIAAANPIFGIGTFEFGALADYDPVVGQLGAGSESFLTGLYVRVGLPTLLLVAGFLAAIRSGAHSEERLRYVIGLLMFVAMLSYGSFINVYDFVFLVMIGLLAK